MVVNLDKRIGVNYWYTLRIEVAKVGLCRRRGRPTSRGHHLFCVNALEGNLSISTQAIATRGWENA